MPSWWRRISIMSSQLNARLIANKMQKLVCGTFGYHVMRKRSANFHWQCASKKPTHCSKESLKWVESNSQQHVALRLENALSFSTHSFQRVLLGAKNCLRIVLSPPSESGQIFLSLISGSPCIQVQPFESLTVCAPRTSSWSKLTSVGRCHH